MKSKMMEVEVFEANDGKIFFEEDACIDYENSLCWDKHLELSQEYINGSLEGVKSGKDLKNFLEENKVWIFHMMNWDESDSDL